MKLVPDTSVVIDGRITSMIREGEYNGSTIIIPEAVVAELESQANQGREIGFSGLIELQQLSDMAGEGIIELEYTGKRPSLEQVKLASGGEIDALIRDVALEYEDVRFITSDIVQAEVAKAKGLDVLYLKPQVGEFSPLGIDQFFDETTISVHLKERVEPFARKGTIEHSEMVHLRETPLSEYELRQMAQEILERAKRDPDGFVEVERKGVTIVQIGSMRISIVRRPFSDGMEITAFRPVLRGQYDMSSLSSEIKERLARKSSGILIAGPPGSGKTTLAEAIASYFLTSGQQVCTVENPRDLQVPDSVTQFSALDGSMKKTAEVLVLIRPDHVIFDGIRVDEDFQVYMDMRLAGVGTIGVVHSRTPWDAIQRFINRVDFSTVANAVDTLIFVDDSNISVYDISLVIGIPTGMEDVSKSCPIIRLSNGTDGTVVCDVFCHEGQVIVLPAGVHEVTPVSPPKKEVPAPVKEMPKEIPEEKEEVIPDEENLAWKLAEREIKQEIGRFTDGPVEVKMLSDNKAVVYIDDRDVPAAIGKGGKNVAGIVNKLSIGIDIKPLSEFETAKEETSFNGTPSSEGAGANGQSIELNVDKKNLVVMSPQNSGKIVDVFGGKEYLFTATVNDNGEISIAKSSGIAQDMLRRYQDGESIRLKPVGN
ncbi:PINc/VapC family ATPase [Methanogenium organophilum]|uniref:PINc/VapC family ATPase n=1 Tax=Methanogenium organophilum TaxID=2199 RepID=A0A9X9S3B9_METOG|nr:PINc/VapC family ATPase [Methanogenium organophilum]WAI00748.1 PINc/VapC family ATPase [Methanogenium organophilum]